MSENQKKPHGWFFRNFIVGLIFSCIVWSVLSFAFDKDGSIVIKLLATIILGILGAFGYLLCKLYADWVYTHFVFFTRNPLMLLLDRYIITPAIGCIVFPIALGFLVMKLMGKL